MTRPHHGAFSRPNQEAPSGTGRGLGEPRAQQRRELSWRQEDGRRAILPVWGSSRRPSGTPGGEGGLPGAGGGQSGE